jgi:DNA-binding beta-propeller fold protein YncE
VPPTPVDAIATAFGEPLGFGSALAGSTPVGAGPSLLAVDPQTHTVYVSDGFNDNGPSAGGDTVSVIDTRRCNARDLSRCDGSWPTITVGSGTPADWPGGIAIDQATDTVYVANVGANTVSVFNGATCNALDSAGCNQTPATVPVGLGPVDLVADPANRTVYVANFDAPPLGNNNSTTVSMIDTATCNAADLAACPTTAPPTVDVGNPPDQITVDQASDTAYVTTLAGWSVFNADTCNATSQSGCGSIGYLAGDPAGPNDGQVDPANDTLYTANYDNTISAFNLRNCDAADLAGCSSDAPGIVTIPNVWSGSDLYVAVDAPLDSVYVSYQGQDLLAVVDTRTCSGGDLVGCAAEVPPTIHTGASPEGVVLDPSTQTLYAVNEADSDLSVINPGQCDAFTTSGCTHPAPSFALPVQGTPAVDPGRQTVYVPDSGGVAMIDADLCNARRPSGCARPPAQAPAGENPVAVAIDQRTGTVYVANFGSYSTAGPGTISVLPAADCNALKQSGCDQVSTLEVPGGNPVALAVDPVSDTLYAATITDTGPDLLSVFNAATCNAATSAGCDQTPATLPFGSSGDAFNGSDLNLALDPRTNTVYATDVVWATQDADTVYVIDGATCDAQVSSGCGQTPATITVGDDPRGLAVDELTRTLYVVNHGAGDYAASLSVIDAATCNAQDRTGCAQTPPTAPVGFGAYTVSLDPLTRQLYVPNLSDSSVSVTATATCNAQDTAGCEHSPTNYAVATYPFAVAIDPSVASVYVMTGLNLVSVIPTGR